jgi:hypothetical protein
LVERILYPEWGPIVAGAISAAALALLARPDIDQELLQRRALERGAGECTIIVPGGD